MDGDTSVGMINKFNHAQDRDLLNRFVSGESEIFDRIVNEYKQKIFNFIFFQINQKHHDAEDLTQDVFVELHRNAKKFRGDSTLETFLFSIARNIVLKYFRANRRRFWQKTESLTEDLVDPFCLEQDLTERRTKRKILVAMSELSAEERQILYLCDKEGFSYEQIGQILKTKIGTVKSRLNAARQRLLEKLKE